MVNYSSFMKSLSLPSPCHDLSHPLCEASCDLNLATSGLSKILRPSNSSTPRIIESLYTTPKMVEFEDKKQKASHIHWTDVDLESGARLSQLSNTQIRTFLSTACTAGEGLLTQHLRFRFNTRLFPSKSMSQKSERFCCERFVGPVF